MKIYNFYEGARDMKNIKAFIDNLLDKNLKIHGKNVKVYSRLLSEKIGVSDSEIKEISEAGYFHDIGKILIDSVILEKEEISLEEFDEIKTHTIKGFEIVKNTDLNKIVKNVILYHHEKWDGSGYPYGLQGAEIPIEAQIVSVADVYSALREKRCYKEAMTHESACEIVYSLSGKNFNPKIIKIFKKYSDDFKIIKV